MSDIVAPSKLLSVSASIMQKSWLLPQNNEDIVAKMVQAYGIPEVVARLLDTRSVLPEEAVSFLNPKLSSDFPDPWRLKDMEPMCRWLAAQIAKGRKIGVFADFDVDGATSSGILIRFIRAATGQEPPIYIPDRQEEGYGPNVPALAKLKEQGVEIVLMCDCGTTAFDVLEAGANMGLEIVVLDHHEAESKLPKTSYLINPKRQDDTSGLEMLAACGVCFLAMVGLNRALREDGHYERTGRAEPAMKDFLDLVALGTVCDMVPMRGPNRLFVRAGFQLMANWGNPGLKALAQVGNVKGEPDLTTAGFVFGPRINAGSRVHQSDLGAKLLSTDDFEEAMRLAWILEDCNDRRRSLQAEMLADAVGKVSAMDLDKSPVIMASSPDWHVGLCGLVAGQIKDRFGKPACIATYLPGEGGQLEGRGSARSVKGINIAAALIAARNEGLLTKGGGHAMAGGFTFLDGKEDAVRAFMGEHVTLQLAGGVELALPEAKVDGLIGLKALQPKHVRLLEHSVGPFGVEHPEPVFVIPYVRLAAASVVGKDHVRCQIVDWQGGARAKGIAFRSLSNPLGKAIMEANPNALFHVLAEFRVNEWQGRESVDVIIHDLAGAEGSAIHSENAA